MRISKAGATLAIFQLSSYPLNMELQHYSPAAERNKEPIYEQLKDWLSPNMTILEIGSASGQHALFFSEQFPSIQWQPSDRQQYLAGLENNLKTYPFPNIKKPIELDVMSYDLKTIKYDAIYTANTLHIMDLTQVETFLTHLHHALKPNGLLIIYGPFKYNGKYTSDSNKDFDAFLKNKQAGSCIKEFEYIYSLLTINGFQLKADIAMPANNQLLCWQLLP